MLDMIDIIIRISYFREKNNLSARELSLRIGKAEDYISKLESRNFNLPTKVLLDIIEALGVSAEEFFARDYKNFAINDNLKSALDKLSARQKALLFELLESN
ncbi:MAG: helix-turn-helix transcriptional regulator [Clostridia bacterium]|nr:helix-turn-helix transcriptional regulator [Clostridia bacterium]